jgi:sortase A
VTVGAYAGVMRRTLRIVGSLSILLGVLALAYAVVVWRWNDPITSLYTRYEQRQLADDLDRLTVAYPPPAATADPQRPASRAEIAATARRLRREATRGQAIGRIVVPRLGIDMVLVNGTDHDSLKKGPGRDTRTFMPGEGQLVYVAGHRTTYLAPFAHIDRLEEGDRVQLEMPYGTFVYQVTSHVIVQANDLSRLQSHAREEVALQACHPRFSASKRYIVYARPVAALTRSNPSA